MFKGAGLGWAAACVVLGVFNIADYLYQGRASLGPALSGLGFLALAPHSYLRPIRMTEPLAAQFKTIESMPRIVSLLAVTGVLLLLAGVGIRWL